MKKSYIIFLLVAMLLGLVMGANVAWQHYHCQESWAVVDPLQIQGCTPLDEIEAWKKETSRLAGGMKYIKE